MEFSLHRDKVIAGLEPLLDHLHLPLERVITLGFQDDLPKGDLHRSGELVFVAQVVIPGVSRTDKPII